MKITYIGVLVMTAAAVMIGVAPAADAEVDVTQHVGHAEIVATPGRPPTMRPSSSSLSAAHRFWYSTTDSAGTRLRRSGRLYGQNGARHIR